MTVHYYQTLDLRLHDSAPKAILNWDIGLLPMKYGIAQKKLLFYNLCKRVTFNEIEKGIKGLSYECIKHLKIGLLAMAETPKKSDSFTMAKIPIFDGFEPWLKVLYFRCLSHGSKPYFLGVWAMAKSPIFRCLSQVSKSYFLTV